MGWLEKGPSASLFVRYVSQRICSSLTPRIQTLLKPTVCLLLMTRCTNLTLPQVPIFPSFLLPCVLHFYYQSNGFSANLIWKAYHHERTNSSSRIPGNCPGTVGQEPLTE